MNVRSPFSDPAGPLELPPSVTGQPTTPGPGTAETSHHSTWQELVRAKNDRAKSDRKTDKSPASFSPWSTAGALGVVVGVILILARLFRRTTPMFQQSLPPEALEILGRRIVDPRQTILLVRIGARILVLGSSAQGLTSLGELADPVEVDVVAGMCRRGQSATALSTSFFKLLKGEWPASIRSETSPGASGGRVSAPRREPVTAAQMADEPQETRDFQSPPDGSSQPEYDLRRRLRETATTQQAANAEAGLR